MTFCSFHPSEYKKRQDQNDFEKDTLVCSAQKKKLKILLVISAKNGPLRTKKRKKCRDLIIAQQDKQDFKFDLFASFKTTFGACIREKNSPGLTLKEGTQALYNTIEFCLVGNQGESQAQI